MNSCRWLTPILIDGRQTMQALVELGYVGFALRDRGVPLLVRVLGVNNSIPRVCEYALWAYKDAKPSSHTFELARRLLDPNSELNDFHRTVTVPEKMVGTMHMSSLIETISMLVRELAPRCELGYPRRIPRLDLTIDDDRRGSLGTKALLAGTLCRALAKAAQLGIPVPELVQALDGLPKSVRPRFVAWLYSVADGVDCSLIAGFILDGCRSRSPTGEDGLLLDRLWRDCGTTDVAAQLPTLIGKAPESERLTGQPLWNPEPRELQSMRWARAVRHKVKLEGWEKCLEITDALGNSGQSRVDAGMSGSPSDGDSSATSENGSADPFAVAAKIASRGPGDGMFLRRLGAYDDALDLVGTVQRNAQAWADNPVRVIEILRHPAHIADYFHGLARAKDPLDAYAGRIVDATRLAFTRPWKAATEDRFYESSWDGAESAGLALIESMVDKNVPLDEYILSRAWDAVLKMASGRPAEPAVKSPNYLDAALGKPHTRALQTLIRLIVYAKNKGRDVPGPVLEELTKSLSRTGQDGAERRAILGDWASRLHTVLPDWFMQNAEDLFGSGAPDDLGGIAFAAYLWSGQDAFILEKYRSMVLDLVKKDSEIALDRLLRGMFWGIGGYGPAYVAKRLTGFGPRHVSSAGSYSAWLLQNSADTSAIRRGVEFWDCVLKSSPKPEALTGFCAWAGVAELDQRQWEGMALRTCETANGKLARTWHMSRRIRSNATTDASLRIMAFMVQADLSGTGEYPVGNDAMAMLTESKDDTDVRESWTVLRDALIHRGYHEAGNL